MSDGREFHLRPEPTPGDREAVLEAVERILRREAQLARPAAWTLGGWSYRRSGVRDFGRWLPPGRRWALSERLPWGGREYPGLIGRGDAK